MNNDVKNENRQAGKGSRPRPVNYSVYLKNWDEINWDSNKREKSKVKCSNCKKCKCKTHGKSINHS